MYKWISKEDNRKLLKDGVKLLKPLLPENAKNISATGNGAISFFMRS